MSISQTEVCERHAAGRWRFARYNGGRFVGMSSYVASTEPAVPYERRYSISTKVSSSDTVSER